MINPYLFAPMHGRVNTPAGKYYLARFVNGKYQITYQRKTFKTATEAADHARRVIHRWRLLYDAAIERMAVNG